MEALGFEPRGQGWKARSPLTWRPHLLHLQNTPLVLGLDSVR